MNRLDYEFSLFVSVALLKPIRVGFSPEYAEIVMNVPVVFDQARERVSGSGVPDLHLIEIRDFAIPLPPVAEQSEIVRRVDALSALADKIEARVHSATARVEKITQAILAKAFRGELVPTEAELARQEGREYEPAAALLEHIRAHAALRERKPWAGRRTRGKNCPYHVRAVRSNNKRQRGPRTMRGRVESHLTPLALAQLGTSASQA